MPVLTKINTNVIAEDAITGDKFAGDTYLENTTTQNITGTYAESRVYTSDAYTLSGNATVNGNLVLSSVKPNDDVVLTAGGAYTITGTGVLSGGSLYGRQTLTGMTGELGSTVTQVSGYTLGSGIIFPSGHVLEIKYMESGSSSGDQTVSTTVFYGFGDVISMSVPTGQSVMMQVSGGLQEFDVHHDHGPCVNWDLTTFSSATQGTFGFNTGTNSNSKQIIGPVMAKYSNSSGSTTTLYVRAGMRGWSASGTTAAWYGDVTIALKRFFLLTRFMS